MPKIWRPTDNSTLRYYVNTILDECGEFLTNWESNFINDISISVLNGHPLTQKQEEILERIYSEKTK